MARLGSRRGQAGVSSPTPSKLASRLPRLPATLHKPRPHAMTNYSQAPRGLSTRYTFRAGRNLPDKEFRYLRTVIVTAAVHRGFISELAPLHLTFRHWAGVSPYTSAFAFAETCVFGKQSVEPLHCDRLSAAPLLPKLRGLFAEFLNRGSLARLRILNSSTCVGFRYGQNASTLPKLFSVHNPPHFWLSPDFTVFLRLSPALPTAGCGFCTRLGSLHTPVRDSSPVVHHLRFSASA